MALGTEPHKRFRGPNRRSGWFFAAPWLVGVMVFTVLAMIASIGLSMLEWDGVSLSGARWVGLENYRDIFSGDADFRLSLRNTVVYAVFAVPLGLVMSLLLAMLLDSTVRGIGLFRTLYYMPHVLSGVATIMIWRWIFHPDFGLANSMLRAAYRLLDAVGISGAESWPVPGWLFSPTWAKPAMLMMSLWSAGGAMLIFLAALQNVPEHLYEAARIDGAGRWRCFRHVTLPQISAAFLFNLITGIIGTLQIFNQAFLLQSAGQRKSLLFYVVYLYRRAFEHYQMGYASALAWVLFVIILVLTGAAWVSTRRWIHYEGER